MGMNVVRGALHRLLAHPSGAAAKRFARDTVWAIRGSALQNPSLPGAVGSMLFVCQGNICRSPFAAARAAQLLAERGHDGRCDSAGLVTRPAERPPKEAREAARRFGLDLAAHQPAQVSAELLAAYDVIVVMEAEHLWTLRRRYPQASERVLLLPLLDERRPWGYARYNIADPFGQPLSAFVRCYERIDHALQALGARLPAAAPAAPLRVRTAGAVR